MPALGAILDHRGWWSAGPNGYVGPSPTPPAGPPPRRVALADVRLHALVAIPAKLDAELEAAFGPTALVVTQALGAHQQQCFGVDESDVARAEAWPGVALMAPYPLAVQAGYASLAARERGAGAGAAEETVAIVEPLGEPLLITVCRGARILAYRQTDSDPAHRAQEIRRTLLGLAAEASPGAVLVAQDLLPMDLTDFTVRPLGVSCVALHGLSRLERSAGFLSREAVRARGQAAERARRRRDTLMSAAAAGLGGLAWLAGWIVQHEATATQQRLISETARLQSEIERLAPRTLGSLLTPRPLGRVGDLLASLPPGAGLVQAVIQSDEVGTRVMIRFKPTDSVFGPRALEAALRGLGGVSDVEVHPSVAPDGQMAWEGQARLEARRGP